MNNAKVSIVLPVYNGAKYLSDAIQSILNQTHKNFELIVLDDGSTDQSEAIILNFKAKDDRITYIKNETNLGLIETLNKGLEAATGHYIARMDQDDIAFPERLKRQVEFLEKIKKPAILGTNIVVIDKKNNVLKIPRKMHENANENFWVKFRKCPVHHPTVMMSKEVLSLFKPLYLGQDIHVEDYSAWLRVNAMVPIYNLETPLLFYRIHDSNISTVYFNPQIDKMLTVLERYYLDHIGHHMSKEALESLLFLKLNKSSSANAIFNEVLKSGELFIAKYGNDHFVKRDLAYCIFSLGLKSSVANALFSMKFIIQKLGIFPLFNAMGSTSTEGMAEIFCKPFYKLKLNLLLKK